MKAWLLSFWQQLNERERSLLLIGGAVVFVYLIYAAYMPLKQTVLSDMQNISEKRATLEWMRAVEMQYAAEKNHLEALEDVKGLTVFSEALAQTSFHTLPYQLQQMENGALALSFDSVPYQEFLNWLSKMRERYRFNIQSLDIEKTDQSGLVKLSVILQDDTT